MKQPSAQAPPSADRLTQIVYQEAQPVLLRRTARLRVVHGPDRGRSCLLDLQRVRVGTTPDCELALTDPLVSRHHLEFQIQDAGFLVRDQQSTNGTYFRGARINEALLMLEAEIRLGDTVLRLDPGPEASSVISGQDSFAGLIGTSPAMRQLYGLLRTVAPTDVTVLLEGETGTGKELVAEAIHRGSPRSHGPCCVLDCGSIPAGLIESEIFGHERGAYTGAAGEREGVFERARGGVVFLDEIGELPLALQTRLLRVLDRRRVRRLGGDLERRVDVRVIAATNRDLAAMVRAGTFRQDLYYRLAVIRLVLPPLRERPEDISLLARHFLWQAGCADPDEVLTPELQALLQSRAWPGNVRELRNLSERAVVLAAQGKAALDLSTDEAAEVPGPPASVREGPAAPAAPEAGAARGEGLMGWLGGVLPPALLDRPLKEVKEALVVALERSYLEHHLGRLGPNISRLAQAAGLDRHMVRILLRKHGLLVEP